MKRGNKHEWPGASVNVVVRGRTHCCDSMGAAVGLLRLGMARFPVVALGGLALDELADIIAEEIQYGNTRNQR
jgi:hypothetical protein